MKTIGTHHHIPEDLWKSQIPCLFMIYVVMLLVAPSYVDGGNDYRIIRKNVDTGNPSLI